VKEGIFPRFLILEPVLVGCVSIVHDDDPRFKLHAITGISQWTKEAAYRVTEKKKKKLTLKGYSKVLFSHRGVATAGISVYNMVYRYPPKIRPSKLLWSNNA